MNRLVSLGLMTASFTLLAILTLYDPQFLMLGIPTFICCVLGMVFLEMHLIERAKLRGKKWEYDVKGYGMMIGMLTIGGLVPFISSLNMGILTGILIAVYFLFFDKVKQTANSEGKNTDTFNTSG